MWRRKAVVAGSFYPENPDRLRAMIDGFLSQAPVAQPEGEVVGLISPHAGYIYSGPVAAHSFKIIAPDCPVVVVLAPCHRARFNGAAIIPDGWYETPLGDAPIDGALGARLAASPGFTDLKEAHQFEHSLEVQVPFIQSVVKNFTLVPVVVGTADTEICSGIARGLAEALEADGRKFCIIISTDLSHYHSYRSAVAMDGVFIDALKSFNVDAVGDVLSSGKAEACGHGPLVVGMMACARLGARRVEILKYANSGDTAGDKNQVVGYLAAALMK
jgi:AmmeMemoRadiSam system protein B